MDKIKILNHEEFISDLFLYTDDFKKLPFKGYKFDLDEYIKMIYSWNKENLDKKLPLNKEVQLLVVKKDNSFLKDDIFFKFIVKKTGLRYIV